MRWRALLSSCHPFTAGHKTSHTVCMDRRCTQNSGGILEWRSWSVQWPSLGTERTIYQMAAWINETLNELLQRLDCGKKFSPPSATLSTVSKQWGSPDGTTATSWQSINFFSRQIMSTGAGAGRQSWWRFASRVSHSCWYRQCSVFSLQKTVDTYRHKYCQKRGICPPVFASLQNNLRFNCSF